MRTVVCSEIGPPELLAVVEQPSPPCGPRSLRVAVAASGVNYVDGLFVQGLYQIKPPVPFVPGSELAGTVTEVGTDVLGWSIGDTLMANVGLGGYCDEIVIGAQQAIRVPAGVDLVTAAAIGQSYCTAWFSLTRRVTVTEGDWVLVLGAAGGVGLASIDVAKMLGAHVIAVASTGDKRQLCLDRGADAVIDPGTESVKDRAREISGGGVDIAIDPVGGDLSDHALRALGFDGELLIIGFAAGPIPKLAANQILLRNRRVVGVDWGAWAMAHPDDNASLADEVLAAVAAGSLHPIQPSTYRLEEAGVALRDLLDRRITGKAVLTSGS